MIKCYVVSYSKRIEKEHLQHIFSPNSSSFNVLNCKMCIHSDCQRSTKAINLKPTPGTAPASQLSGEASYIFVSHFNGLLTLTNLKKALDNYIYKSGHRGRRNGTSWLPSWVSEKQLYFLFNSFDQEALLIYVTPSESTSHILIYTVLLTCAGDFCVAWR